MNIKEPSIAFPYKPPSDYIKQKYSYIFYEQFSIKQKFFKLIFDKVGNLLILNYCKSLQGLNLLYFHDLY